MGGGKPPHAHAPPARRPDRPKRRPGARAGTGSTWALLGLAGSLALGWALAALKIGRRRREDVLTEQALLAKVLRQPMLITEHAACRMVCRHIDKEEVYETLQRGRINRAKSRPAEQPCPKYVVDASVGKGRGKKPVQVVVSACQDATKLVTVIDKKTDWECFCP